MKCPLRGNEYTDPPVPSRTDNETPICPVCGTRQVLEAAGINGEKQDEIISQIYPQNK